MDMDEELRELIENPAAEAKRIATEQGWGQELTVAFESSLTALADALDRIYKAAGDTRGEK